MWTTGDPVGQPVYVDDVWTTVIRTGEPLHRKDPVGGTGEPLHRKDPVPVGGSFPPVGRFSQWQGQKDTEVTERRVLDSITQPNEHTVS